jgi:hypothetical protein
MAKKISRRDFIKTTTLSAAGVSLLSNYPVVSALGASAAKSRVVIATDQQSYVSNTVNQTEVQTMVNQTVMALTGISTVAAAFESLFPNLTTSTKIVIKYNDAKPATTRQPMTTAITNSLKLMLNGTFPAANITLVGKDTAAAGTKTFVCGGTTNTIRSTWDNCDYFINCPPCYAINTPCGVAMSLKNMITAFSGMSISSMHNYYANATDPALSKLNGVTMLKDKQRLVMMDAISISADGTATKAGYSIIASKDMVAVDYQGIQLLKANGLSSTLETSGLTVCSLAASSPYSIGTNLEANMEVFRIGPPWTSEVISSGTPLSSIPEVKVIAGSGRTVFDFRYSGHDNAVLSVYGTDGRLVWSQAARAGRIVWEHNDLGGRKVPSGAYVYLLKTGDIAVRGKITVKR